MDYHGKHTGCLGEGCPLCAKFDADPAKYAGAIAQSMRQGEPEVRPVEPRPFSAAELSCIHRGEEVDRVKCEPCRNSKAIVNACAIHGKATMHAKAEIAGVKSCRGCGEREPPRPANSIRLANFTEKTSRCDGLLFHFPHGLGDMVMLGYLTPFLPANMKVFIVGGGTGCPSIFEGHLQVKPLYPAANNIMPAGRHGLFDFETDPATLATLRDAGVSHVAMNLPEIWGHAAPPWHTKPRARLQSLVNVDPQTLTGILPNSIPRGVSREATTTIERRLRAAGFGVGRRLCVMSPHGITHTKKNLHSKDAADFVRLLVQDDPRWLIVSLEPPGQHRQSLAGLPNVVPSESIVQGLPFGVALRALFKFTDLFVGVPSGPWCVSHLFDFPTIGIWRSLWPSWYMEPKAAGVNIISQSVRDQGHDWAPGSLTEWAGVPYPISHAPSAAITGQEIFDHAARWM